jgi:hypothetical protein
MDWRTMDPRPFVKYFPAPVSQEKVALSVSFAVKEEYEGVKRKESSAISVSEGRHRPDPPKQCDYDYSLVETPASFGPTISQLLGGLAFARSGDRGSNADVGFWVRGSQAWPWFQPFLTRSMLVPLLVDDWQPNYRVERCEFGNLHAAHLVVCEILQDSVSSSRIIDGFGKSVGELCARVIDLPLGLGAMEDQRRVAAQKRKSGGRSAECM